MITCHYCGTALRPGVIAPDGATTDHVVPIALRGLDVPWNRVPACRSCNQTKADRMPAADHVSGCDFCTLAVARWTAGMKGRTRAERRQPRRGGPGASTPAQVPDRPDLAPLSPAMRAYLLDRERRMAAVRWDGMRWVWTGRKNLGKGG